MEATGWIETPNATPYTMGDGVWYRTLRFRSGFEEGRRALYAESEILPAWKAWAVIGILKLKMLVKEIKTN
jgi:hypothetical protein